MESVMNLKRKLLVTALPFAFCVSGLAHAMTLKIAEIHPAGYPTVVAQENMGKKIAEATKGELDYRMFAGGVLGSEKEVVEQVQLGAVQMTRVSLGTLGPVVPDVNVFNMPFVFRDHEHMRKVIDGDIGQEILDKITNSEFNMVGLAWMDGGVRNLYTKEPVRSLEDLKGMKIRVIGNPMFIETFNALGASGIAMDTGEIFSALQSGVIDRPSDPARADRDLQDHLEQAQRRTAGPGEEVRQGSAVRRAQVVGREVRRQRSQTQGSRGRVHRNRQETLLRRHRADPREVRRALRRTDQAHRSRSVILVQAHRGGRCRRDATGGLS